MYVRSNSFADNSPADGGQVRSELDNIQRVVNRTAAVYVQSITTNALTDNQIIYRGWGYKDLSATTSGTIDITLPNGGFDNTNYQVSAIYLGEKATAPSSRSDVTSHKVHTVTNIVGSSTTSTVFRISFYSNGGGNFGFVLFDWTAIGTKT